MTYCADCGCTIIYGGKCGDCGSRRLASCEPDPVRKVRTPRKGRLDYLAARDYLDELEDAEGYEFHPMLAGRK